ncbi:hypothetical protein PPO43_07015 [Saprospira sp. CCB-QB6]|uniref:hypothetical protein n=1 Tax=Saprospira sp. CCB-QB6 TaxID=3023936 RepID=UPI00234981F9|nr:hypothetical protein [Saprospira sp. CCB-QB6]WCL82838.1 hypothetical protein PPO43_07015 [Saprospira sp. CCB-QB6]
MRFLSTFILLLVSLSLWAQKSEKQKAFEESQKDQKIKSTKVQIDQNKFKQLRSAPSMQMYQKERDQSVKAPAPLQQLQDAKVRSNEDGRPSKQEELLLLELQNQATPEK